MLKRCREHLKYFTEPSMGNRSPRKSSLWYIMRCCRSVTLYSNYKVTKVPLLTVLEPYSSKTNYIMVLFWLLLLNMYICVCVFPCVSTYVCVRFLYVWRLWRHELAIQHLSQSLTILLIESGSLIELETC